MLDSAASQSRGTERLPETGCLDPSLAAPGYRAAGWWSRFTVADYVARNVAEQPDGVAFYGSTGSLSWAEYDRWSDVLAGILASPAPGGAGLAAGDRVAIWLPDTPSVHVAYLAAEKAGVVVVGVGARAGYQELRHLLDRTGAEVLVTLDHRRGTVVADLRAGQGAGGPVVRHHVVIPEFALASSGRAPITVDGCPVEASAVEATAAGLRDRRIGPDDLWLINSTSGTTGMPKCVLHTQNRWMYFHQLAVDAGELTRDEVFLSALPAPFGFGIWTAHVTPTLLGAPCVVLERFAAEDCLAQAAEHQVSVLSCVSTQFIMMLNSPMMERADLEHLRVVFTGGEAVPYAQASRFEEASGAALLQFFGSNETGALSRTVLSDGRERRLRTAGRIIPEMQVRLFDDDGREVPVPGRGVPAGKGPATCLGYLDDPEANAKLFTSDDWMLMGDVVEIDEDGYLTLVGRTSDIIIRGGKNISAVAVEEEVATHPAVALAAAVAMPDPVFGERVCVFVECYPGASLDLDQLLAHLTARGVSKEYFPEHLVQLDELPRSSGRKVAKGQLRADLRRRRP